MSEAAQPVQEIDFSQYCKPELAEHVAELLNVPKMLQTALRWTAATIFVILLLFVAAFAPGASWTVQFVAYVYGVFLASLAGLLVGVVVTLNKSFGNLVEILRLSLDVARQAMIDARQLRDGHTRPPTARQIVRGVYLQVMLPMVQRAVLSQSRWLGRPLLWVCRFSLGRLLRRVLATAPPEADTGPVVELDEAQLAAAQESAENAAAWFTQTRDRVATVGHTLRRTMLVPLSAAILLLVAVLLIPPSILWYFA